MKRFSAFLAVFICLLALCGCSNNGSSPLTTVDETVSSPDAGSENEVLDFLQDQYGMTFKLWGPEGHDLYAFYIYEDHAQRECHILMPENTDDIAEYHEDLSWEVVGNELIITGAWQKTFTIDIAAENATSAANGKVYQLYDITDQVS